MNRRRFLAVCGGTFTGIWLAGTGLVALERKMVLDLIGACSFCGKRAQEVFGLAGLADRGIRICDECVGLCFDIIAEEDATARSSKWTDPDDMDAMLENYGLDFDLKAALEAELNTTHPPQAFTPTELVCSFCDRSSKDVAKLIAGPSTFICDECIGDAGAILLDKRLRA